MSTRCFLPFGLKVDVDTHDGMRLGVPVLLEVLRAFGFPATFFLSFGPDNAGKAIGNLLRRKGFLRKMVRTGAPRLYGWRTILSGTLLPARPIAAAFPELVRRIAGEGHEVGVHAWDHRLWQDHLGEMDRAAIEEQFARAFDAYERILGHRPRAVAAPAWNVTPLSLEIQDTLGLDYASDAREGPPAFPVLGGYRSTTLQVPTTQPCLEEILAGGERDPERWLDLLFTQPREGPAAVMPLHAEVEGGRYRLVLERMLGRLREAGGQVVTLGDLARRAGEGKLSPATREARLREIPGRSGQVFSLIG